MDTSRMKKVSISVMTSANVTIHGGISSQSSFLFLAMTCLVRVYWSDMIRSLGGR